MRKRRRGVAPSPANLPAPSQLVLEALDPEDTRGELLEMLVEIFDEVLGPMQPEELSNGGACDTLMRLLDLVVVQPEQRERLVNYLQERSRD